MNSQQHKRITLKDISEQCGYSVNTVSRALRDDPRLPEATISRIKQVADELGYMKNIIASSMRSGHTGARKSSTSIPNCSEISKYNYIGGSADSEGLQ